MKKILFICLPLLLISCTNKEKIQNTKDLRNHENGRQGKEYIELVNKQKEDSINQYINQLSLEEKISQLFIINIDGDEKYKPIELASKVNPEQKGERYLIPGGYLFFSFNISDEKEKLSQFINSISDYCNQNNYVPPFLSVDQEGGEVCRLRNVTTYLPSQKKVGETYSLEDAYTLYENQGKEMKELGFNMNFAPVTEVINDSNKDFLGSRSFGDYEKTVDYSNICINAYNQNNIGCVIKHFPGNTNTDPHSGLPEIKLSEAELNESIKPFYQIIKSNPAGVLMSHARTSAYDSKNPACLSYFWVTEKLRNEMNYNGIIFSDDIFMKALKDNGYPQNEAVIMALNAGIDCIMISEKRFAEPCSIIYEKALADNNFLEKINKSVRRIIDYKINSGILIMNDYNGIYKIENKR